LKIKLDNIEVEISQAWLDKLNIKLNERILFTNEKIERAVDIVKENYAKIKAYYISNLSQNQMINFDYDDLNIISVEILIYYFNIYTRWKEYYVKSNYDIKFYEKDFNHPDTYDIIIFYLKQKYPDNWKSMSQKYINMTSVEFDFYWTNRIAYFNK
jgi:hypothetical protein